MRPRSIIAFIVVFFCVTTVFSGLTISAPTSGWADPGGVWPTVGEEYRWGATARNMDDTNGDWELGVGNDSAMSGDTLQLNWGGAGTSHPFVLDYDPLRTEQVRWTMDGQDTVLLNPNTPFSDLYVQLKARPSSSQAYISVLNTTINVGGSVASIDDFAAGYGEAEELQYVHLYNFDSQLSDLDFILSGTLYIDWTGTAPSRDAMGMHIKTTQIPEPTSIVMIAVVSGFGLFIGRKFRS